MTIIVNGNKLPRVNFQSEKEFEDDVVMSSKLLFGKNSIYINAKKKIDAKSLGGTIPDGFFFDFSDKKDPQFYIVEVEIEEHDFDKHVFPQITKFFVFFKNQKAQKHLIDQIFIIINNDETLKNEIKSYLGTGEIYKFVSDLIGSSQNILLISNGYFRELNEIFSVYSDTWGKMVKFVELNKYSSGKETAYTISPDIELLPYDVTEKSGESENNEDEEYVKYSEEDHLDGVDENVKEIYSQIKLISHIIDEKLKFNPQKYYISIKDSRNIIFLKIRNKKIRMIVKLPEDNIRNIAKHHMVITLIKGVQDFYGSPCSCIEILDLNYFDEIETLIRSALKFKNSKTSK